MNKKFHSRINSLLVLSLALLTFTANVFATSIVPFKVKDTLAVCSYTEFKPVSYANGQGYEADLLRAIAALWQVKIKFYPQEIYEGIWLLPMQQKSPCDLAAGGITPSEYRIKQGAQFSMSTLFYDQSLLVRKKDYESGRITSFQSFKNSNMKIGVVPGTTGEKSGVMRAKAIDLSLNVFSPYKNESDLLPALLKGDIDAIARGEIGNEYQVSLNNELLTIAKENFKDSFAFAVDTTSNKTLLNHLNQAIRIVTDEGKISYFQWLKNPNVFIDRVKNLQKK